MKKKIIVPVDFSKTAQDAYWYAREMAKNNGATLEIVHTFHRMFETDNPYIDLPSEDQVKMLKGQLDQFVQNVPSPSGGEVLTKVAVTSTLIEGDATDVIIKKSKEEDTLLVIMGNRGKHHGPTKIFGSVSSVVAQNAVCPVILIPPGTRYRALEQVLFATNYESANQEIIKQISDLANTYRASLHFVHIHDKKDHEDFTQTMDQIVQKVFQNGDPAFSLTIDSIDAANVLEGLYNYAQMNTIDLIVVVNRERSFIKNVLGRSTTQKIAADLEYPVLVYHLS